MSFPFRRHRKAECGWDCIGCGVEFGHKIAQEHRECGSRVQPGLRLSALVCQNAGRADPIIYIVMGVAVDPQRNTAFCDQGIEVREKGWRKRAGCMVRRLRASAGRMMSNNNCASGIVSREL